jgi:hypothetical protein
MLMPPSRLLEDRPQFTKEDQISIEKKKKTSYDYKTTTTETTLYKMQNNFRKPCSSQFAKWY